MRNEKKKDLWKDVKDQDIYFYTVLEPCKSVEGAIVQQTKLHMARRHSTGLNEGIVLSD